MRRVFLIVLDSLGIGQMPDAYKFSDKDCNTLKRISGSKEFKAENMLKLGIGNIDGIDYIEKCDNPLAATARMSERSNGKDTTIGHWEIAGIVSQKPMPTFPNGFPENIIYEFSKAIGRKIICNKAYSGTEVIKDYGKQHIETGALIVYTSADSVFQIAAHESVVPVNMLYEYCKTARKILKGDYAVGRVIARPFTGEYPNFIRTANRHDFSLKPPKKTLLDALSQSGKSVCAIGKISDIFAGSGVTEKYFTHSNAEGMQKTFEMAHKEFEGLCFTNLVDFDMLYGHRQDIDGYAAAFSQFDKWIVTFLSALKTDDILMITADHGCDPGDSSTDHTREYTPLIVYGKGIKPINIGTRQTFADIAATISDYFNLDYVCDGESFLKEIIL